MLARQGGVGQFLLSTYCRHEMPDMQAFMRKTRARPDRRAQPGRRSGKSAAFMAREGYRFPVAMADGGHAAAFGGVSRLPTSFLIDKQGRLRKKISGQVHYARLADLVEPLLNE
jgi:hypothetical protein